MKFDAINRLRKLHRELNLPGRVEQTPQGAIILVQPLAGNETDAAAALRRLAQPPEDKTVPRKATIRVTLPYYPEWAGLLAAKLTPDTPLADRGEQDDDPTVYRHDRRSDFIPFPNRRNMTHHAVILCESDDDRYSLKFRLVELADEKQAQVTVYECPVAELKPQVIAFSSDDLTPTQTVITPGVRIEVELVAYGPPK